LRTEEEDLPTFNMNLRHSQQLSSNNQNESWISLQTIKDMIRMSTEYQSGDSEKKAGAFQNTCESNEVVFRQEFKSPYEGRTIELALEEEEAIEEKTTSERNQSSSSQKNKFKRNKGES